MSIYSDQLQQLTDKLVADVANLNTVVTNNSSDFAGIDAATTVVETTANSFDQAIKTTDIPPENTMVLDLSTSLLLQIDDLQAAITANASTLIETDTKHIFETTININRCVTSMSEYTVLPPAPEATPLPPWLLIPTVPPPES